LETYAYELVFLKVVSIFDKRPNWGQTIKLEVHVLYHKKGFLTESDNSGAHICNLFIHMA